MNTTNIKPVDFRFGQYLSEGYALYSKNFGKVFLAFFFMLIMSLIPFCSYLALGNFYKFMKKLKDGQNPEPSEIFNFDDFMPYLKFFLIIFAVIIILEIPIIAMAIASGSEGGQPDPPAYFPFYVMAIVIAIFFLFAKGFYMPGLISLKKITSVREAWRVSSKMTSGNVFLILGFLIVITVLSQLGFIALIIGVLVTLPFYYTATFAALDDGLKQQPDISEDTEIRKF